MKKIIIISVVVIAIGAIAGLYFGGFLGGGGDDGEGHGEDASSDGHGEAAAHETLYMALEPPFIVNFIHRGTLRYLQISLELMYEEQSSLDKISAKMPAIRNDLILLFSNKEYENLSTLEGKEALRDEILLAVNNIVFEDELHDEEDHELIESIQNQGEVYITNFVMQ